MAVDSNWSSVALLLPMTDDTNDVKGHTITAYGGATLSSAAGTPFGAGNALCSSMGLMTTSVFSDMADFTLLANNFTIEAWINFTAHTTGMAIVSQRAGPGSDAAFIVEYNLTAQRNSLQLHD